MNSLPSILPALEQALSAHDFWGEYLHSLFHGRPHTYNVHLAIFIEPYLEFVLEEKKTIESRFSITRCAPYRKVNRGDVILLKRSGGRIIGLCRANQAYYYALEPGSLDEIRIRFGEAICPQGNDFWTTRERASFASLIKIDNVARLPPIQFEKRDRRGWVVIGSSTEQEALAL